MEQEIDRADLGEIVCRLVEMDVGIEEHRRDQALPERVHFMGQQKGERRADAAGEEKEECWKNPSCSPIVEIDDGIVPGIDVLGDQASDQIAGDNEKDVDADKTARRET